MFRLHLEPDGFLASLESCAVHEEPVYSRKPCSSFQQVATPVCTCVHARARAVGGTLGKGTRWDFLPVLQPPCHQPSPQAVPQTQQGPAQRKVPQRRKVWDVQIPIKTPGTQSCKDTAFLEYLKKIYARSPGRFLELEEISGTWSQMDHLAGALKCRFIGPVR